jgi:glycosyltransferase involved in cell wall biosynthesis
MILVSVVIPIFNGENDLPQLILCLQSQDYSHCEFLLVDNASVDSTSSIIAAIAAQDKRFRCHQARQIQSAYAARNVGIKAAKGEIIAFTDVDCRPRPDWLSKLVLPFADPKVQLVAGEILALPGQTWLEHYAEQQQILSQEHTLNHPCLPYAQTANLAIRRAALVTTGLFRPYLTTGGDADLCWRVQLQFPGCLVFQEQAIVSHRHRATLGEFYRQWYKYGRSNRYLCELHGVELMQGFSLADYGYRLLRWLVRELPSQVLRQKYLWQPRAIAQIFATPLGLWAAWARFRGQNQAVVSQKIRQIEFLEETET